MHFIAYSEPSAPTDFLVRALDANTVEVTWQPPLEWYHNITSYIVIYTKDKDKPQEEWQQKQENNGQ